MSASQKPGGSLTSTVALKVIMAVTGLALVGFVFVHMLGHLQMFLGREVYNDYAEAMQSLGPIKWAARFGLLGVTGAHVMSAIALTRRNRAARPEPYAVRKSKRTTPAAKMMAQSGLVILLFVLYHLAHFTLGWVHPEFFDLVEGGRPDVYNNFILSFRQPLILVIYLAANFALAAHLSHAIQSVFKTLGLAVGQWRQPIELIGPAVAIVLFIGYVSVPLACFAGVIDTVGYIQ